MILKSHLDKIDDSKSIFNISLSVGYTEVVPLYVFVGIQVISQPQFIVIFSSVSNS